MTLAAGPLAVEQLPRIGPAVTVMGVFDGVHLGHQALLAATREASAVRGVASVALIFDPHPDEVIRPGTTVPRLASPATSQRRVAAAGIDHVLRLRFDDELRGLSPEAFLASLAPAIELRALVMTAGAAFGHGRSGSPERMAAHGAATGFDLVVAPTVEVDGQPVSSSRIRDALSVADLVAVHRLLGHPALVEGTVVEGDHRGRLLGYPTANLDIPYAAMLPPLGIYLGCVEVADRGVGPGHPALVSVGARPTFHQAGRVLVEAWLMDFDDDLYGTWIGVELHERLRDERRFDSAEALVAQMRRDEDQARQLLAARRR